MTNRPRTYDGTLEGITLAALAPLVTSMARSPITVHSPILPEALHLPEQFGEVVEIDLGGEGRQD